MKHSTTCNTITKRLLKKKGAQLFKGKSHGKRKFQVFGKSSSSVLNGSEALNKLEPLTWTSDIFGDEDLRKKSDNGNQ